MIKTIVIAAALASALFTVPAEARHRHRPAAPACVETFVLFPQCPGAGLFSTDDGRRVKSIRVGLQRVSEQASSQVLGGRPSGCPSRFCGCSASLRLFGRIIPSLNLAANWLRFPRAAPAPKMAAARRGHVFVLERHISGSVWLVHDGNSGGHTTRLHARSISGFVIVDPSGAA